METSPPPTAAGRKRARPAARYADPQLREKVLALIHATRVPLAAQRRSLERAYDAAWRAFCRASDADHEEDHALTAALCALSREATGVDTAREVLARKIASSVVAARSHARHQRLLLVWTWLGHTSARRTGRQLWRFGAVLLAVDTSKDFTRQVTTADEGSRRASATWLRDAMRSLTLATEPTAAERLLRRFAEWDPSESVSSNIVQYLVRIAFSSTGRGDALRASASSDMGSLARDALDAISQCGPGKNAALALVCRVVSDRIQQQQQHESGDAVVALSTLRGFLRAQVKASLMALVSASVLPSHRAEDDTNTILATLERSLSAVDVVQLFRHVWVDAKTASPDAARDPMESLAPLISCCAQRDRSFRAHALATAHDLVHDAITASDAVLLGHSLELAGAATVGTLGEDGNAEDAGYTEWFRTHFAAVDGPSALSGNSTVSNNNMQQSLSGHSAAGVVASHACLRARPPTLSSGDSTDSHAMCGLVSTKRHLQFVCAFLSEFDRAESPRRKAHHVLAHLSAIKTHQTLSGSAVGGLLSDFFSQARARYNELNVREQEVTARLRRRRLSSMSSVKTSGSVLATPSQATPASSQHESEARGKVEELLELHGKDQAALGARVNQLKMFEPSDWKHKILPCCLDLEYWQTVGVQPASSMEEADDHQVQVERRKRVSAIVSLVQALAKHRAVGTTEYVAFLERVEAWFLSLQQHSETGVERHLSSHHSGGDQHVTRLGEVSKEHFDGELQEPVVFHSSWGSVTSAFVVAFEGLVFERPAEQVEQMERIHEATVRLLAQATASRSLSLQQAVDHYLALWIALLSNETVNDATPQERMDVMEAYCKLASQRAVHASTCKTSLLERLAETALLGSFFGLLASVSICEAMARTASLAFCVQLEPTTAEPNVDDLVGHLKQASAFLSGFLTGFIKNPTDNAPQMLLQSMLTPQMRECLIWVGQHTSTWWNNDLLAVQTPTASDDVASASEDPFWPFVQRTIHSVHDQHGWFRLTFSPGVFTTKDQWQVFVAMELTCCVTQLLDGDAHLRRTDVVHFISRQHEQIHGLMLSSTGGQSAGVRVVDVCMWIVQTTLELSASTPRVASFALDALVLLLKDVWATRGREELVSSDVSSPLSDVLGFLMELALQLLEGVQQSRRYELVHYAVRCASVLVDVTNVAPLLVNIPPHVTRNFVDQVCLAGKRTVLPFEWVCATWCIVLKLQHTTEIYTSASEIPGSIFAHWAFEFPRLCRSLTVRKNGKVSHATNAALLRTVQTCYEFFRTLNVRRLAPAPSKALFSVSASQYVPSSAADETLELHVRALEWLIASDRLSVPTMGRALSTSVPSLGFEISLAFHEVAGRVLGALLEDVSIGRPEEVANEVTEICQTSWLASVSSEPTTTATTTTAANPSRFPFQLLLIHIVADLAASHASVGRCLLRSSSELLRDARQSLFLLLVLIASKELEQIESMLQLNGSLWVNTFAEVACALTDIREEPTTTTTDVRTPPSLVSLIRHSTGFESQLVAVLSRMLNFAAAKQIDLLDTTVTTRVEQLFPSLRELVARVPVLNLASAALGDW